MGRAPLRFRFFAALFVLANCAAGCVQPLGPGFRTDQRDTEIRAVPGEQAGLHVQVTDRLTNDGNRSLSSLDVRLPEGPTFGTQNLRVTIDGREITTQAADPSGGRIARAALDPVWQQKQVRNIVVACDFLPQPGGRGTIEGSSSATIAAFYIADPTAFPQWQPPHGVFARGKSNPLKERLTVLAPPDFRVLAPGKPLSTRKEGALLAHSFRINPDSDFPLFVVAGRYSEQSVIVGSARVSFWTFHLLTAPQAQAAAARLDASFRALADEFGSLSNGAVEIHIIEAPENLPSEFGGPDEPGGEAIPEGVLLDSRALAAGIASDATLELAEYELARTWFGWRGRLQTADQILMGRGAGLYGVVIAAEARSAQARQRAVRSLLSRYDEARERAADVALNVPPANVSRQQRISTGYKAALFFVALEDLCGRENLRAAFHDLIGARGGDNVAEADLFAAAEAASHQSLGQLFRTWLNHPGVPDDFRAKYSAAAATGGAK